MKRASFFRIGVVWGVLFHIVGVFAFASAVICTTTSREVEAAEVNSGVIRGKTPGASQEKSQENSEENTTGISTGSSPGGSLEDEVVNLADMNVEDLMKMTVASRTPISPREAPGIVSIVTREEIINSGARDLIDVFRLVPGFQFASDFNGTVGMGVRGLWGLEGKILFMLDGHSITDLYYNSALFGDRIPLDQISRIEIIRGPGSAIYGSQAEFAVINIITQTGAEMSGVSATLGQGFYSKSPASTQLSVAFGKKYGTEPSDLDVSIKTYFARTQRSDRNRLYASGDVFNMYDSFKTTPQHINLGIRYRGFSARFIIDRMGQYAQDNDKDALVPTEFRFDNYIAALKYDWQLSPSLKVTPEYSFTSSYPYFNEDPRVRNTHSYFDVFVMRHKAVLPFTLDIDHLNLVGGADAFWDIGGAGAVNGYYDPNSSGIVSKSIHYSNFSLFGQGIYTSEIANITAGARLENHSTFGTVFVPRLGATKVMDRWHFKFLFSRAFRYPSVGNINDAASSGSQVVPEFTQVFELESGFRIAKNHNIVLNLYSIYVDKPIVFIPTPQSYGNFDSTGTKGFELQYKINGNWGYASLGYSYYNASGLNQVRRYIVSQDGSQLSAFAPHVISANSSIKITKKLQINPQAIWHAASYTYSVPLNSNGDLTTNPVDPFLLLNLYLSYNDLWIKNLSVGLGVFDLLDSSFSFSTAYDLQRNPMPGPPRQWMMRVGYQVPL